VTEQVVDFGGLAIAYDDEILEPRPWTLAQAQWAQDVLAAAPDGPVLELCAGAGQIGLVVARATGRRLVQVDADEPACAYAERNAAAAGIDAEVRCRDLEHAVADDERFALVLADPPYVPTDAVDDLPEDPDRAIDGGADGLDLARTCVRVAAGHLVHGGAVLLQLGGPDQAGTIAEEAASLGLEAVETRTHGVDRSLVLLRRGQGEG
jgi:methylase of polypeptide subunit release factors